MLTISQLAPLKTESPYLYETLSKLISAVNAISQHAGVDSVTPSPAPQPIASIKVQAANGYFDLSITDTAASNPGLAYFAESDTTPAFNNPRVYFLGASRNLYLQLGNQTLYWRAFSQFVGSLPSTPVNFGAPPAAVAGGGATGPAPFPSTGSGTPANNKQHGGNGFGTISGARIKKPQIL